MICPVCKRDMIDVEHEGIELDYCNNCQGVWFDSEELELLLGSLGFENHALPLDDILRRPQAASSEQKRRCPICGQKMRKATIGRQPPVLIDACPQGDGLWFDGGEVAGLVKSLAQAPSRKGDSQQQVTAFLGDVFKARG